MPKGLPYKRSNTSLACRILTALSLLAVAFRTSVLAEAGRRPAEAGTHAFVQRAMLLGEE